jgi:hypothetical protein
MSEGTRSSWMRLGNLTPMQTTDPPVIFPRSSIFYLSQKKRKIGNKFILAAVYGQIIFCCSFKAGLMLLIPYVVRPPPALESEQNSIRCNVTQRPTGLRWRHREAPATRAAKRLRRATPGTAPARPI